MSSASNDVAVLLLFSAALAASAATPLRVCADPNNLPYSNDQKQGFENRLADLIAKDLDMEVTYFWFPQREAFFRNTLNRGVCDAVMGVPSNFDQAESTRPYYRSSYVFITRRDRDLHIASFDDPRLRQLKIGVHVLGEEDDSLPPVHALVSRGIVRNLVGFSIFGNLNEKNPPADLVKAVESGSVDVAIAWGPMAGYFAQQSPVPLDVTPVASDPQHPELPFQFDIAIGVRQGDVVLRRKLDAELVRRKHDIDRLLRTYGVPLITLSPNSAVSTGD